MTAVHLRPLKLGEILDRTFALYRRHFLLFVGIAAIPRLLVLAAVLGLIFFAPVVAGLGNSSFSVAALGGVIITGFVSAIAILVATLLAQGATVAAVSDLYLGRETSVSASLKRVWGEVLTLLAVAILSGLAVLVSAIFLIIPGIIVFCRLLVSVQAAIIEQRGASDSLSRSWNLTRGFAWRALLLYLVYLVVSIAVTSLVNAPFQIAIFALGGKNSLAVTLITVALQVVDQGIEAMLMPIYLIASCIYYFDLRVRKEAFDLQFMLDPTSERMARDGGSVPSILG